MVQKRKKTKVKFNTTIVQDVGMAALATRLLPIVVNNFYPLNATLYSVVGAGGGYLTGSLMKNNTLANASIALGLVEFIAPMLENMLGGLKPGANIPVPPGMTPALGPPQVEPAIQLADYVRLNDYVANPSAKNYNDYADSY